MCKPTPNTRSAGERTEILPISSWRANGEEVLECGIPVRIGQFVIEKELGRGAMGIVYRAFHPGLDRHVALKVLQFRDGANQAAQRFAREISLVARLNHPGIVTVYETGLHEGQPYFAMELVEGQTLAQLLAFDGPLTSRAAAELLRSLAQAMSHAHNKFVLHRDLKPSNILLDDRSHPHITDFGLSRPMHSPDEMSPTSSDLTEYGVIIGTPAYMAPEQVACDPDLGPGVDIYALGILLYECLTGRPPFQGRTVLAVLSQHLRDEPLPPRALRPSIPADLEAICLRCLQKDPQDRYHNAAELAQDLTRFLEGEPLRGVRIPWHQHLGRLINVQHVEPRYRAWSRVMLLFGVILLLTQGLVTVFMYWATDYFRFAVLGIHASQLLLLWGTYTWARPAPEEGSNLSERLLFNIWVGFLICCFLFGLLSGNSLGPMTPLDELRIYPPLCVLSSFALLVTGTGYCGYCHVGAGLFVVLALSASLLAHAVVPIFGIVWAITLTLIAMRLDGLRG